MANEIGTFVNDMRDKVLSVPLRTTTLVHSKSLFNCPLFNHNYTLLACKMMYDEFVYSRVSSCVILEEQKVT